MGKTLQIAGNIQDSAEGSSESTGNFDLGFLGLANQNLSEAVTFQALLSNPYVVAGPFPASVIALRVMSGGPVTLLLTGPGGTDQAVQVSESFLAVAETTPFTALKMAGSASVELLLASSSMVSAGGGTVGGNGKVLIDGSDVTADFLAVKLIAGSNVTLTVVNVGGNERIRIDVPSLTASSILEISDQSERYVTGTTEQVLSESTEDFDLLIVLANVKCTLNALSRQSGGATGTYRVRVGGTLGAADGAIVAQFSTTLAAYALPPVQVVGSPFARPSGRQLVKLTAVSDTAGQRAFARASQIVFSA